MKQTKVLSTIGVAALGLAMSATASQAGYFVPGETMGGSLLSPVPEGVFAIDQETYGRSNNLVPGHTTGVGINIPALLWSTPISFYNTRLEIIAAVPFGHVDGAGLDRFGALSMALGPLLAHDFGNGLTGGLGVIARTPDPSSNFQDLSGRTVPAFDVRESLKYTISSGPFQGITLMQNAGFTSCFCTSVPTTGDGVPVRPQNDFFAGDFTIEKSFGKFTIGAVGFGNIDTNNVARLGTAVNPSINPRERGVELGGLVSYDFGRFTLIGMATHSVLRNNVTPGEEVGTETRGWVKVIVPLYIAPPPSAPVVARY